MRGRRSFCAARSISLLAALAAAGCPMWSQAQAPRLHANAPTDIATYTLRARVVAVGVGDVGGVRQVGFFHAGGPIPGNPEFLLKTRLGRVLDPARILVASGSNFGAPLASAKHAPGSILSIDPQSANTVMVARDFAVSGGGVAGAAGTANSALQLYSAQSAAYLNRVYNPKVRTADEPAVSNPRYISINNAFGRPWFASSPFGARGPGTSSVLDPDGRPLDNAPSNAAGGVFVGSVTDRTTKLIGTPRSRPPSLMDKWMTYRPSGQLTAGSLSRGAVGTAFLGASPDTTGFAVFAVVLSDGSVVQVHVQDGVDGLAPPGTIAPVAEDVAVAGIAFRWIPDRALFIADRARDRIAVLDLSDDTQHFKVARVRYLTAPELRAPIDLAAAIPEVANPRFSSHTTLAATSDLFVANRGDGSLLRLTVDGRVVARAQIQVDGVGVISGDRLRALAVSSDAQKIWLTLEGELPQHRGYEGVVLEVSAFDSSGSYRQTPPMPASAMTPDTALAGARLFKREFVLADGLGPLFNQTSCVACHNEPSAGGFSSVETNFALRVARSPAATGRIEELDDLNGPVARRRSTRDMMGEKAHNHAPLAGIPRDANVVSIRMPTALYAVGALDTIPDGAILAHAVSKGDGIRGRANRVRDTNGELRVGRYGWKADIAHLDEMVANALATELGITSPLVTADSRRASQGVDDDGSIVRALVEYVRTLSIPTRVPAK